MTFVEPVSSSLVFGQLKKIYAHPRFLESEILRRFLTYIVKEMLANKSERIKEYSIAIEVLNKPVNFNPKINGVVRVHARRLRDALQIYYEDFGKYDACIISIPKGRYIPLIQTANHLQVVKNGDFVPLPNQNISKRISIELMPFKTLDIDNLKLIFADHIRLALITELAINSNFHVIYNPGIRQNYRSIKNAVFEPDFIVTGTANFSSKKFRIIIQLTDASTKNKIWTEGFNFKYDITENYKKTSTIRSCIQFCLQKQAGVFMENQFKLAIN